jgi:hypothetical protein
MAHPRAVGWAQAAMVLGFVVLWSCEKNAGPGVSTLAGSTRTSSERSRPGSSRKQSSMPSAPSVGNSQVLYPRARRSTSISSASGSVDLCGRRHDGLQLICISLGGSENAGWLS